MSEIRFANIVFKGLTRKDIYKKSKKMKIICTVNAEYIVMANRNDKFRRYLAENISTFDGQIPYIMAKKIYKMANLEKISGSDIIYEICENASRSKETVFLLGSYLDINLKTRNRLKELYNVDIDGYAPPHMEYPFEEKENAEILKKIKKSCAKILLTAFGAEKHWRWIEQNKTELKKIGLKMVIEVGGAFDMISGEKRRAPKIIQKIGMESIYRFLIEPKMFRAKKIIKSMLMLKYVWHYDICKKN